MVRSRQLYRLFSSSDDAEVTARGLLIVSNEFDSSENSGAITVKATADSSEEADVSAIGLIVEGV